MKIDTSFIIPALNSEKTIQNTIQSIRELDLNGYQIEILVVDNGSTDKTVEKTKSLNVPVLHCPRKGAGCARNFGARYAKGEFLAFIDSDIILDKKWFQVLRNRMSQAYYGIALGSVTPVGENSFLNRYRKKLNQFRYKGTGISVVSRNGVGPAVNSSACIYRKDFFLAIGGFNEQLSRLEDTDLSLRLFIEGANIIADSKAKAFVYFDKGLIQYAKRFYYNGIAMKANSTEFRINTIEDYKTKVVDNIFASKNEFNFTEIIFYYLCCTLCLVGMLNSHFIKPTLPINIKFNFANYLQNIFSLRILGSNYKLDENTRVIQVDNVIYFCSLNTGIQTLVDLSSGNETIQTAIDSFLNSNTIYNSNCEFIYATTKSISL